MVRLIALFLVVTFAFSALPEGYWSKQKKVLLAKDEFAIYKIGESLFYFRWTLWVNHGLVMHYHYDGHPIQNILYKEYKRNAFKLKLHETTKIRYEQPYVRLEFKGMEQNDSRAQFALYLYDPTTTLNLKEVK
jgi:hypothetical protein